MGNNDQSGKKVVRADTNHGGGFLVTGYEFNN